MKVAITGKGGVGKTTLSSTLARLYADELDYINKLYWSQEINTDTYNALMSASGNLPHN